MSQIPPDMDLSQVPLAPNPKGEPPDFDNGPSLQVTILVTGIVFIIVGLVSMFLRLLMSWKNTRKFHLDDYFCSMGLVAGIAYWFILYELQISQGLGRHTWDVPVSAVTPTVMKGQAAAQVLTAVANPLVKGAILLFFIRLFGTVRWVRIVCYTMLALVMLFYSAYLAGLLAMCIARPGEQWDDQLLRRCDKTTPGTIAIGVFAMLVDIIMFIIPFFIIRNLNIDQGRKLSLVIVFMIGFLIVVASVVGLAYRIIIMSGTIDPIWNGANVSITAYTEIFGTVIVSCTPALSSFWLGVLIKSTVYSSLRSKLSISKLRVSNRTASASLPTSKKPGSSATSFQEHSKQTRHGYQNLQATSSTQELVDLAPALPQAIQKSTAITQYSSQNPLQTNAR